MFGEYGHEIESAVLSAADHVSTKSGVRQRPLSSDSVVLGRQSPSLNGVRKRGLHLRQLLVGVRGLLRGYAERFDQRERTDSVTVWNEACSRQSDIQASQSDDRSLIE